MSLLLDTHALLWSLFSPRSLSAKARRALADPGQEIIVSSISFWEISIKYSLGKLELPQTAPDELPEAVRSIGFTIKDPSATQLAGFYQLPFDDRHRDPFDRLLVWIALQEKHHLVSKDRRFSLYQKRGLQQLW